jgi:hypothetical protein
MAVRWMESALSSSLPSTFTGTSSPSSLPRVLHLPPPFQDCNWVRLVGVGWWPSPAQTT